MRAMRGRLHAMIVMKRAKSVMRRVKSVIRRVKNAIKHAQKQTRQLTNATKRVQIFEITFTKCDLQRKHHDQLTRQRRTQRARRERRFG